MRKLINPTNNDLINVFISKIDIINKSKLNRVAKKKAKHKYLQAYKTITKLIKNK